MTRFTDNQTILFIALSFGMSLVVVAWVFFRICGAAFNPAGMMIVPPVHFEYDDERDNFDSDPRSLAGR